MTMSQETIFIIDDEPANLAVLCESLGTGGFKVFVKTTGESALKAISEVHPDLILLDVMMPGIDGFETCRRLKADNATKDIPVIFMTALSDTSNVVKGRRLGAADYITKPFHVETVLARIKTHLTLQTLRKEVREKTTRFQQENRGRRQAERALRQSQNLLKQIFASLEEVVFVVDSVTRTIILCNPAVKQIFGYNEQKILGETPGFLHADKAMYKYFDEDLFHALDAKEIFYAESQMRRKDGNIFIGEHTATELVDDSGHRTAVVWVVRDITEQKRAEEALHHAYDELELRVTERTAELSESNALLKQQILERERAEGQVIQLEKAVETMQIGVTITDLEGKILYVNQAEATMHGYQVAELLGKKITLLSPAENQEPLTLEEIKGWKGLVRESINIRKDGSSFPVWLMSEIVQSVTGEPYAIVTSCEDITERKAIEEEREKYRDHLEELVKERTTELTKAVTETKRLNEQLLQEIIERKQAEELLQQRNRELALLNQVGQMLSSTIELDQVLETVLDEMHHLLNIESTSFWLRVPKTGELVCQQATGPEKETVIGWRLAPGQGTVGQAAQTGEIIIVADTRTDTHHYKGVDQKTGMELRSIMSIPFRVKGEVIGVLSLVDTSPNRFTEDDLRLVEPIAAAAASAVENARLYTRAQQEIAERKRVEKELQKAKEDAEEAQRAAESANKAKSEFLANMSHEIRTPMNAVLGFTELLDELITEPQQKSYLDAIKAGGKNLLMLINDILDLSKIEAGKMEILSEPVNLKVIFQELSQIFQVKITEKELKWVVEIASRFPDSILLDEVRLRQVLFNLIGNAIKFTDQGYVKLTAKTTVLLKDPSRVDIMITVEDSGIGIPEDQQELIFDAFRQQNGQKARKYGGTGLGLAITKRFVEMMGGTITLTSELGTGTCFTIVFLGVPVAAVRAPSSKKARVDDQQIFFEQATVLVVDDIRQNRLLIKAYFKNTNLSVIEAENGEQAIRSAQQYKPDIILIDLRMPVMDGYEATQKIRNSKSEIRNVPIIALTASAMKQDEENIKACGFDGYLRKPVNRAEVFQELARFLPHSRREIPTKQAEPAEPSPLMSAEHLKHLPELIEKLEDKGMILWNTAYQSGNFKKIKEFGIYIKQIGERYAFDRLQEFGKNLLAQVSSFDVKQIQITLETYPKIIEKVKLLEQ